MIQTTIPKSTTASFQFSTNTKQSGASLNSSLSLLGLNKSDLYTPHINALKVY